MTIVLLLYAYSQKYCPYSKGKRDDERLRKSSGTAAGWTGSAKPMLNSKQKLPAESAHLKEQGEAAEQEAKATEATRDINESIW